MAFATCREGPRRGRRPDLDGQALGTAALVAARLALIEGGEGASPRRRRSPASRVALVARAGFVAAERRAERPMLDPRWFRRAEFTGANVGAGADEPRHARRPLRDQPLPPGGPGALAARTGLALVPLALPSPPRRPSAAASSGALGPRCPRASASPLAASATSASPRSAPASKPAGLALLAFAGAGMGSRSPAGRRRDRGARPRPRRHRLGGQQHQPPGRRRDRRRADRRLLRLLDLARDQRGRPPPGRRPGAGADGRRPGASPDVPPPV